MMMSRTTTSPTKAVFPARLHGSPTEANRSSPVQVTNSQPKSPFSTSSNGSDATTSAFGRNMEGVHDILRKASVAKPPHFGTSPRVGSLQPLPNRPAIPSNRSDSSPTPPRSAVSNTSSSSISVNQRSFGFGRGRGIRIPNCVSPLPNKPGLMKSLHSPEKQQQFPSGTSRSGPVTSNVHWDDSKSWRRKNNINVSSPAKPQHNPLISPNHKKNDTGTGMAQTRSTPNKLWNTRSQSNDKKESADHAFKDSSSMGKAYSGVTIIPREYDRRYEKRNIKKDSLNQKIRVNASGERNNDRKLETQKQILSCSPRLATKPSPYAATPTVHRINTPKGVKLAGTEIKTPDYSPNSPRNGKAMESQLKQVVSCSKSVRTSPGSSRTYPRGQSEMLSASSPTLRQTPSSDSSHSPVCAGNGRFQGRNSSKDLKRNESPAFEKTNNKHKETSSTEFSGTMFGVHEMDRDTASKAEKRSERKYSKSRAKARDPGPDDDIDDILDWFETMFQRQSQRLRAITQGPIYMAEKDMPHLLSDYQTLFPKVNSPTCVTLPSVVTSRGDRWAGVPRRVKAKVSSRCSSPPTYLGRVWGAGLKVKGQEGKVDGICFGAPLWSPMPRALLDPTMNGNNNNKHIDSVCSETDLNTYVILEELPERKEPHNGNPWFRPPYEQSTICHPDSIRKSLKEYVSRVTSAQDLPIDVLKANLLQLYNQGGESGKTTPTSSPRRSSEDGLFDAIDDVITEIDLQRRLAAQKVAGMISELICMMAKTAAKQKEPKSTSKSIVSQFWSN